MTKTDALAEMKFQTEQQSNGTLADTFAVLITMESTPAVRLTKSVVVDELTRRNAQLLAALDAWELDLEATETHDELVLRYARRMNRDRRWHLS